MLRLIGLSPVPYVAKFCQLADKPLLELQPMREYSDKPDNRSHEKTANVAAAEEWDEVGRVSSARATDLNSVVGRGPGV
jgi:hypothetical protein